MPRNNDDIFGDGVKPKNISYEQWEMKQLNKVDIKLLECRQKWNRPPYQVVMAEKLKRMKEK